MAHLNQCIIEDTSDSSCFFTTTYSTNRLSAIINYFKFNKQMSSVVKSSFFQLRTIAKIKSHLPPKQLEMVIHAFISTRIDYCNSLYIGIDQASINLYKMQQPAFLAALKNATTLPQCSPPSTGYLLSLELILKSSYLFLKPNMTSLPPIYLI